MKKSPWKAVSRHRNYLIHLYTFRANGPTGDSQKQAVLRLRRMGLPAPDIKPEPAAAKRRYVPPVKRQEPPPVRTRGWW